MRPLALKGILCKGSRSCVGAGSNSRPQGVFSRYNARRRQGAILAACMFTP